MHTTSTKAVFAAPNRDAAARFQWTRKHTYIAAGSGAALLICAIVFLVLKKSSNAPPPMNAPIEEVAKFVGSSSYSNLPFDRQREYMQHLHINKKKLAEAFKNNKIKRDAAQQAVNYAWCGKRLHEMQLYASAGEGEPRNSYLTTLALQEIEKAKRKKNTRSAALTQPAADDEDETLPRHNPDAVRQLVLNWPEDVQRQWRNFERDLVERQAEIKKDKKSASGAVIKTSKKNGSKSGAKSGRLKKSNTGGTKNAQPTVQAPITNQK